MKRKSTHKKTCKMLLEFQKQTTQFARKNRDFFLAKILYHKTNATKISKVFFFIYYVYKKSQNFLKNDFFITTFILKIYKIVFD